MNRKLIIRLSLYLILLASCRAPAIAQREAASITLNWENDSFAGTDRHYTHGTRLTFLQEEGLTNGLLSKFLDIALLDLETPVKRWGVSLGQNMYTPANIRIPGLIRSDRPYAGWLYGGLILQRRGTELNRSIDVQDHFEVDIGIVGPSSFAKETQIFVHRNIGATIPQGWNNQIRDEVGLVMTADRAYRLSSLKLHPKSHVSADIIPDVGFTLGNVATYMNMGINIRAGYNLPNTFGPGASPALIRPSFRTSDVEPFETLRIPNWGFHLFGGVEGRLVGRNIFLDGNTWQSSHSVDRELLVADLKGGFALRLRRVTMAYTYTYRTREFSLQSNPHQFASISIQVQF